MCWIKDGATLAISRFFYKKISIFCEIWYQTWILRFITFPKKYTLIHVTVKIQKSQRSINFKNSGLTPLLTWSPWQKQNKSKMKKKKKLKKQTKTKQKKTNKKKHSMEFTSCSAYFIISNSMTLFSNEVLESRT